MGMCLTINKYPVLQFSNFNHFSSLSTMMRKQLKTISGKYMKNEDLRISCTIFLTQEFVALVREIFEPRKEDLFFPAPQRQYKKLEIFKDYLGLC